MEKTSRDYVVCLCNNVTRGEIEDIIKEKGYTDLKTFCEETKIGKKCGGCREDIQMILDEMAE